MLINKITLNSQTLIDLTSDTVLASDVGIGKTVHLASGEKVTGTQPQYIKPLLTGTIQELPEDAILSISKIADYKFAFCPELTTVTIPSNISEIGSNVFEGCSSLVSVTVKADIPPMLGTNVFKDTNSELVIYVPSTSITAYQTATNWAEYASKIVAIPEA